MEYRQEYEAYVNAMRTQYESVDVEASAFDDLPPVRKPLICACMSGGPVPE